MKEAWDNFWTEIKLILLLFKNKNLSAIINLKRLKQLEEKEHKIKAP